MTQTTTDPALASRRSPPGWRAWLILWIPVALGVVALLAFDARLDTFLWCASRWAVGDGEYYKWSTFQPAHAADAVRPFYVVDPPPLNSEFYHRTQRFWSVCKSFGEAWMTLIAIACIALFHARQRLLAGAGVAGCALAGALSWLIRSIDGRYRPTHTDATNHWELFRGFYNGRDLSFPSGHATSAFATAAALSYVFPRGRPLFILLATLTACARIVQEAHFWSDVLFGSAFGWTVSWLTLQWADRFLANRPPKAG